MTSRSGALHVIGICLLSSFAFAQQKDVTTSLQIVLVDATNAGTIVTIENRNAVSAVAFALRSPSTTTYEELIAPRQAGIPPGGQYRVVIPLNQNPATTIARINAFAISAVLFEDGSYEGLPEDVQPLASLRSGRLLEVRRLRPIIEALRETPDSELKSALQNALLSVTNPAGRDSSSPSGPSANGVGIVRLDISGYLRGLIARGQSAAALREDLAKLAVRLEKEADHLERTGSQIKNLQ